jgi:MFS transporter, ACS family, solute carrier family 17 (sodium-dependent inorganic phosphate cotransporter), other
MQVVGLLGSAMFLLIVTEVHEVWLAELVLCGALGTLAFTWSGFSPNHLDIAPRHAGILMGITNTAGTVPGVVGVVITGWLVETTGAYTHAFVLSAAISIVGAVVWLAFATGKQVVN